MTDATEKTEQTANNSGSESPPFSPAIIAGWIAIGGVLMIVVSFFWEWGYWQFFGVSLSHVPMSLDHLGGVVLAWMPKFLTVAMTIGSVLSAWWVIYGFKVAADKRRLAQFDEQDGDLVRGTRAITHVSHLLDGLWAPGIVLLFVADGTFENFPFWIVLIGAFSCAIIDGLLCYYRYARRVIWTLFYMGILTYGFFHLAQHFAAADAAKPRALIHIKVGNDVQKKRAIVLRNYHDFVYAYDPSSEKIVILPWATITRISYDVETGESPIGSPLSRENPQE